MQHSLIHYVISTLGLLLLASLPGARAQTNLTLAVFISAITDGLNTGQFTSDLDGRPFQVAVDIAMEAINNHSVILDGYLLQPQYVDSQVRREICLCLSLCVRIWMLIVDVVDQY